ncbi:tryptophan ABC transporter substrate-binding protein [Streptococcus halichoeri]|uniref:tryptophan ABC transporter substrate-binding protein n=1 Tax=Streptococcus halichoeri TaxID=254785 RepID=UPI0013572A2F|nr:tryptophan ABC transporter substrate-binding protein [Streptococcus halichoeri]
MKNKPLILTLFALVCLVLGAIWYQPKPTVKDLQHQSVIRVGILQLVTHEALDQICAGTIAELKADLPKGKQIHVEVLNAEGDQNKLQTMSKQLVSKNDLVIGIATPAAQALAHATKEKPVFMSAVSDPVGAKLVTNLGQPRSNVTGLATQLPITKTLDLMQSLLPQLKTIGVLYASSEDNSASQVAAFTQKAEARGYHVKPYAVPSTNEIATTMTVLAQSVDALFIPQDNTIASAFPLVVKIAQAQQLPVFPSVDTMVKAGGLACVFQNQYQLGVKSAKQVKQLITGKKLKDIPIEVVDDGQALVNSQVAEALKIPLPESTNYQRLPTAAH